MVDGFPQCFGHSGEVVATVPDCMREVPSIASWVFCLAAYVAVRTPNPTMRDMLIYMCLIIREALRHGGGGW